MRVQESRASLGEIWKSRASLWGNTGGQLWDLGRFRCGSQQARAEPEAQPLPRGANKGPDPADMRFRIMYIMFITPLPDPGFTSHAPDPLQAPA